MTVFSPRARGLAERAEKELDKPIRFPRVSGGWPNALQARGYGVNVFPACAGVGRWRASSTPFSRAFSPRTRGLAVPSDGGPLLAGVFPACAGVGRLRMSRIISFKGFPRERGGWPVRYRRAFSLVVFSPRARGLAGKPATDDQGHGVFPACAGVGLGQRQVPGNYQRFPRMRGGWPSRNKSSVAARTFSPRTRGLAVESTLHAWIAFVFPAHAGVGRRRHRSLPDGTSFPHRHGE